MKKTIPIVIIIGLMVGGCKRNDRIIDPTNQEVSLYEYLPLKIGNSWMYFVSKMNSIGIVEGTSFNSCSVSVLQTNTLIGGQPNAFIMHATSDKGKESNLAFSIGGRTLYHYLGENSSPLLRINFIAWSPGGLSGAKVGLNQNQKFKITDFSGNPMSFTIKHSPDPVITRALMTAADTVQIQGISVGNTTFVIQKVGGNIGDTMTVLVEVGTSIRPVAPPFSSWMPIWQLTHSNTDEIMYSWDTTYSFRTLDDSSLCSDRIEYLITNRFMGNEIVTVSNSFMTCEKFEMKVLVMETVTYLNNYPSFSNENSFPPMVVFNGPSTYYTVTMWLAKEIGFVKGIVNGNTRSLAVMTGGAKDSAGILHGYYFSPRISYLVSEGPSKSSAQYFHIDDTPLAPKLSSDFFVLQSKNF